MTLQNGTGQVGVLNLLWVCKRLLDDLLGLL